jgi:hypothetical protein
MFSESWDRTKRQEMLTLLLIDLRLGSLSSTLLIGLIWAVSWELGAVKRVGPR